MKNIFLMICFFCISLNLYSQDIKVEKEKSANEFRQQVGINSTLLISSLINLSSQNSFFNNRYIFTYKKFKGNKAFRLGIGGYASYANRENYDNQKNFRVSVRIGTERSIDLSKNWRVYYGLDGHLRARRFGNPNQSTSRSASLGTGPLCGLRFNINSRLSISTEASYNLIFSGSKQNDDVTWAVATGFRIPDFLNLNFDF